MALDRRVTLRCLVDDLSHDWDDIGERRAVERIDALVRRHARDSEVARLLRSVARLNQLGHPLIRSFEAAFQDDADASKRETISGTRDPHFWKVKTARWRGAATDHSRGGSDFVWLCAGGRRADGDARDFYASYASWLGEQPERLLPTSNDVDLARVDAKVTRFDAWKLQISCAVLALLGSAHTSGGRSGPVEVRNANDDLVVVELSIETEITEAREELTEVQIEIRLIDRAHSLDAELVSQIARAAVNDVAEEWTLLPLGTDTTTYRALALPETLTRAEAVLNGDMLSPSELVPQALRLGLRAHYAPKAHLVHAQIGGLAVLALCGYWFVPTADHESLPGCDECRAEHRRLPG